MMRPVVVVVVDRCLRFVAIVGYVTIRAVSCVWCRASSATVILIEELAMQIMLSPKAREHGIKNLHDELLTEQKDTFTRVRNGHKPY